MERNKGGEGRESRLGGGGEMSLKGDLQKDWKKNKKKKARGKTNIIATTKYRRGNRKCMSHVID
jgi:hypothetical protein